MRPRYVSPQATGIRMPISPASCANCLADDVGLDSRGIEVEVRNGEVTLSGTVRHCADMKRAEAHACAIAGVIQVRNGLQPIEPLPSPAPDQPGGAAAKMGKPGYER